MAATIASQLDTTRARIDQISEEKGYDQQTLEDWLNEEGEALTQNSMQLSQSAFAEVWDNEEDEIWDKIWVVGQKG